MGYIYTELIPPAILYDNPGLTKAEFIQMLDNTRSSGGEVDKTKPWSYSKDHVLSDFHLGSGGLARVLGLEESDEYRKLQAIRLGRYDLPIYPPLDLMVLDDYDNDLLRVMYEVHIHHGHEFGRTRVMNLSAFSQPVIGTLVDLDGKYWCEGVVTEILQRAGEKSAKAAVVPFKTVVEVKRYPSLESMYQEWSQFVPEFRYNWLQDRGSFHISLTQDKFLWLMREGRYFLDPETFNKIPVGFLSSKDGSFGYTDLILTSEAIKQKAWKLLSQRGLNHGVDFIQDFPDARVAWEKAIIDAEGSFEAQRDGLTHTEFLRLRLERRSVRDLTLQQAKMASFE